MRARLLLACPAVLLLPMPPAAAAPRTHVIVIDKMSFGALPSSIRAGDRITWVNRDLFRHSATSKHAGFDLDLPPGSRATAMIRKSGAFVVICRYHTGMRVTLKISS